MIGTYRLRQHIKALNWDATEDGACAVFDFLSDTECRITDEAVVEIYQDGLNAAPLEAQPSDWIVRQRRGHYTVLTNERFEHDFESVSV